MDITKAEQIALDDALVAPANRLKIGKCNLRLSSDLTSKEATLQVVYDVLKLTPFYKAFQASADVPEIYMQEFWATASVHNRSIRFKMNNKKHIINLEYFREMLQICPKIRNQKFDEPPFEQEILTFLEDFTYQVENKNTKKGNVMYYPRFTKIIVNFFMSKDPSIPRRNKINWHYARDDPMFTTINVISRHEDTQLYGAILPKELTNKDIQNFESYKDYYAIASGEVPPKTKASVHKKKADSDTTPKEKPPTDPKDKRVKQTGKMTGSGKQKQPATGDGIDILSKVPDDQVHEKTGTDEGASDKPEVLDVPEHHSNSEEESWTFSDDDDNDEDDDANKDSDTHDDDDDDDATESDDDGDNITHPKLSTFLTDDQEEQDDEEEQEEDDEDEEEISDYSSVSNLVSKFISPTTDEGIDSILTPHTKSTTLVNIPISVAIETLANTTTIPPPLFPVIQSSQQTPVTTTTTTNPSTTPLPIPNFESVFGFNQRVTALESDLSKLKQSNPFAEAISSIPGIVNEYLGSKMKEAVDKIIKDQVKTQTSKIKSKVEKYVTESLGAEKILYNALVEAYNTDKDLFSSYGDVIIIPTIRDDKEKVKEPSAGSNRGTKRRRSGKEAESSQEPTRKESRKTSSLKGAFRSQPTDLNETTHLEFITGDDDVIPAREVQDVRQWHPPTSPTPDCEWHLTKTVSDLPPQHWITDLEQAAGTQSSFDEFMATPIDFSAFMINRLKIDHLTQELLTGPTYDLIKGTCKSVAELDYHLEEVFKATNEQLDWNNPEGTPYPYNLSKPLPLIPNARRRLVIPFDHFISNDLEYLKGGSTSRKYTTSITKTKVADYGQVKWIEDQIPRTTWSVVPIDYDKHAYWGTYHWGPKRQRFYGYATNMETSKDVYSRHMIISVISIKIMKFFGYSHLEEITVHRQDDVLYKFREGDFKRLRRQDIEDMLLLLVQGKLTNLSVDDRYALNVALRMYTRRIVIQERVEDLLLAVESYQKKINLTRPDTTRPDLRKMTPYTGYPDVQGIIYQDELSRNRLMSTDELHKFSDGTLNHVRITLNDIATGIQMDYLPKRRWSPQDKRRARVMISAIDRKLRDRRLMRSLEKFVGGRPVNSFTMNMEILLELTSNKLMVAGNPVKEILLKLNLPDHRSILTDSKILKDGGEVKEFQRSFRHSDTERLSRSDEVLKLKNFKKDATLKLSKSTNQEWYEHGGPEVTRSQNVKVTRWRNEIMLG
ncbi:hypothetical protein Tco_0218828 [Tanacetum coccineum]